MLGKLINKITGRTSRQEELEAQANKRRALSKHAIYGTEAYSLHEEAYDKDFGRVRGQNNHRDNLYGQN